MHDQSDPSTQPAWPAARTHDQPSADPPKTRWTLHLLIGFIAGPLLGAAVFAWSGAMDLGLASALMLTMIPVTFGISALATSHLIRLVRWLWGRFAGGLILLIALTGWRPGEAPPPNEYVLHLHSPLQALIEGVLGPLNLYFRPSTIFSRHAESYFSFAGQELLALFYIGSFAWLPVSFLVAVALVGMPGATTLRLIGLISGLLTLLGLIRGLGWTGTKPRRLELHPDLTWVFAIYFNAALVFEFVLFDHVARSTQLSFAQIADSPQVTLTVLSPAALGMFFGLSALFGSLFGPRRLVWFGGGASAVLLLLLWRSQSTHMLELTLSLVALALIATHIVLQPVYILWSVVAGRIARIRPDWSERLWRWSPARLTEYVYVPLPGTADIIRVLMGIDPPQAARAIRFLCHHPFQMHLGFSLQREWLADRPSGPVPS
jgi:hypothetical protein